MYRSARPLAIRAAHESVRISLGDQRRSVCLAFPQYLLLEGEQGDGRKIEERSQVEEKVKAIAKPPFSPDYFVSRMSSSDRPDRPSNEVVRRFRTAIKQKDVNALHASYADLRSVAAQLSNSKYATSHRQAQQIASLTCQDFHAAMRVALRSNGAPSTPTSPMISSGKAAEAKKVFKPTVADGKLVQQMFQDMTQLFTLAVDNLACQLSLRGGAARRMRASALFTYFKDLRSTFAVYSAPIGDIEVILTVCSKIDDWRTLLEIWSYMKRRRLAISSNVRDLLTSTLLRAYKVDLAKEIAFGQRKGDKEIQSQLRWDADVGFNVAWLLEGLCRADDGLSAQTTMLFECLARRLFNPPYSATLSEWHALLVHAGCTKGSGYAKRILVKGMERGLLTPNEKTFNLLLQCHGRELKEIQRSGTEEDVMRLFNSIQDICKVAPTVHSFSMGITTLLGTAPSLLYPRPRQREGSGSQDGQWEMSSKYTAQQQESFFQSRFEQQIRENEASNISSPLGHEVMSRSEQANLWTDQDTVMEPSTRNVPQYSPGQVHEATLLYEKARSLGLEPDSGMIHPLLTAHANAYVPVFEKTVSLYQDLRVSVASQRAQGKKTRIDGGVYDVILYASAKDGNLSLAKQVVRDMANNGVAMSRSNLSNLTILLMQASESHDIAFRVYTEIRDELVAAQVQRGKMVEAPFDRFGWVRIINCFSRLNLLGLPPAEYLLAVVSDMNRFGYEADAIVYSSLLHYYGRRATTADEKVAFRTAVLDIHAFLQNEASFEPDMVLITALMDAYNRVDLPNQALEIWNRLVIRGHHVDAACIAVMLDTCGHSGKLPEARRGWDWVRRGARQRQECNKGVWDAYLECLCRCGHIKEAIGLAFDQMRRELIEGGNVPPDAKTMEMLLRFASAPRHRWLFDYDAEYVLLAELKHRLQHEMPDVWDQVKLIDIPLG